MPFGSGIYIVPSLIADFGGYPVARVTFFGTEQFLLLFVHEAVPKGVEVLRDKSSVVRACNFIVAVPNFKIFHEYFPPVGHDDDV